MDQENAENALKKETTPLKSKGTSKMQTPSSHSEYKRNHVQAMKSMRPSVRRKATTLLQNKKPKLLCKKCVPVYDGFGTPIRFNKISKSSIFYQRTQLGYFRQKYATLTNHELYLFEEEKNKEHDMMLALNPGVFIQMTD